MYYKNQFRQSDYNTNINSSNKTTEKSNKTTSDKKRIEKTKKENNNVNKELFKIKKKARLKVIIHLLAFLIMIKTQKKEKV